MYCECPSCGKAFHIRLVGEMPVEIWLALHAPDTPPGEAPRVFCPRCGTKKTGVLAKHGPDFDVSRRDELAQLVLALDKKDFRYAVKAAGTPWDIYAFPGKPFGVALRIVGDKRRLEVHVLNRTEVASPGLAIVAIEEQWLLS